MAAENNLIHILHLSDLYLESESFANVFRMQLEADLIQELRLNRLAYLVLSGDITQRASEAEFRAAFGMVDGLVKRFGLDASRVVVVPGNHDVDWDLSEDAYPFIPKRKLPTKLLEGRYIPAGETGTRVRDDEKYQKRFAPFDEHFYRHVYPGERYPLEEAEQFLWRENPEERILFLGLNSCWQIDHHFTGRASIDALALSNALDRLNEDREKYHGWLKIAVWHHPVTGRGAMNADFMQQLAVHGFRICLHGHIHEAMEGFHQYDDTRKIHIVGAGTFGAPAKKQITGIPLQYNLLTLDPATGEMRVDTRKKEKPHGAWSADARWGDKNEPKAWYGFSVRAGAR
uniref:3',5'-cyclic AMP phosphodiesterase CpdA n=1 Tax=Candidatus Kentrum sp. FM TaxID=2126340 RepID=A0A450SGH7_9GAMM|nr:MAG: 3',5'-cyclic AMP phosphodiesterase CpdA [Candidatus Kentron sp. FM]VFJ52131.1 MAG: 3',5'-cyclic AMP phosphodiesterase CpdA [Candidatus Kentron sp. FM]VFK07624.1 MAG: 3',5'-cyclic AMP phosphodiesterase CpdA [Candidatus Kentron sp. FM]